MAEDDSRGRDLSRGRRRRPPPVDTGRQHHMGGPPPAQPVLDAGGVRWTETGPTRLRQLTDRQLHGLAADLRGRMSAASEALQFEAAAALREQVALVEAEQSRRAPG